MAFELKMYSADVTDEQYGWLKALRHHIPAYEIRYPRDIPLVKWILASEWEDTQALAEIYGEYNEEGRLWNDDNK